jgi:hypothetical protein
MPALTFHTIAIALSVLGVIVLLIGVVARGLAIWHRARVAVLPATPEPPATPDPPDPHDALLAVLRGRFGYYRSPRTGRTLDAALRDADKELRAIIKPRS